MKNTFKLSGFIVLAAVIVFSFITCDNGTTSSGGIPPAPPPASKRITFEGGGYKLNIIENTSRAAAYIPAIGDKYEIRDNTGKVISKGSVTNIAADGTYTFKPDSGKDSFTGAVSDDMAAFQITSTITLDGRYAVTRPVTVK
jgi:hypothetical protein